MSFFNHSSLIVKDPNEKKKNKEILELINSKLVTSEFYTEDCIKYINKILSHQNFVTSSIQVILKKFREEPCITLEEKKSYKINTRQKVNKVFFDLLSEKGKRQNYITSELENIILSSQNKISNKYSLLEFKSIGIKEVEIMCCNDDRDCVAVKRFCNKRYPIDKVPELPLPDCTADLCRCIYTSVLQISELK